METKELSLEEIEKIVESGDPDKFVGAIEASYFEFREKPYYPDNEHDTVSREKSRLELIKDFSSVANSGGGYIIIGLKPDIDPLKFNLEFVKEVKGVEQEQIRMQSWLDNLSSFLTPSFHSKFLKYGFIGEDDEKVFWVKIPDAKEIGCYPFILNKDQWVTENNSLLKGKLLGIYFRDGAENKDLVSAEKLQELLAELLLNTGSNKVPPDIERLEAKVDQLLALQGSQEEKRTEPDLDKRSIINRMEEKLDQDSDFFYLIGLPEGSVTIKDFWLKGENSLYHLLNNPPTLRHMGWDLNTAVSEYPQSAGDALESTNGERKIVLVGETGYVAAGGTIQEFLDWGLNRNNTTEVLNINAFALVEFITSYFNFLTAFVKNFVDADTKYHIYGGFSLRVKEKYRLVFSISKSGKPAFLSESSDEIKKKEWDFKTLSPFSDEATKKFAADVVMTIYGSGFGYAQEEPPYLIKNGDFWIINEELYKKVQ